MSWNMVWNMTWDMMWYEIIWCGIWVIWNGMMLYTLLGQRGNWLSYPLSYHFCTQCVLRLVCCVRVCVCVSGGGCVGGCGVSKTVHGHLGSFNLFKCHHRGDVWIIPYLIRWNMLHVEHISCVSTDCDQQQWVIHFPLSISLYVLLE